MDLLPSGKYDIEVIGHIMNPSIRNVEEKGKFKKRKGILFLASFSNKMFYNGDAIWHFLKYIYKYYVETSKKLAPLTIAGRGKLIYLLSFRYTLDAHDPDCMCTSFSYTRIPSELRDMVKGKPLSASLSRTIQHDTWLIHISRFLSKRSCIKGNKKL